jgi:hypothetical protein
VGGFTLNETGPEPALVTVSVVCAVKVPKGGTVTDPPEGTVVDTPFRVIGPPAGSERVRLDPLLGLVKICPGDNVWTPPTGKVTLCVGGMLKVNEIGPEFERGFVTVSVVCAVKVPKGGTITEPPEGTAVDTPFRVIGLPSGSVSVRLDPLLGLVKVCPGDNVCELPEGIVIVLITGVLMVKTPGLESAFVIGTAV